MPCGICRKEIDATLTFILYFYMRIVSCQKCFIYVYIFPKRYNYRILVYKYIFEDVIVNSSKVLGHFR